MALTGRHLELNGRTFFVRESGPADGRLVLAIPGLSATGLTFSSLANRLLGVRFVAVDLRGRGNTPAGGAYGWSAHAADLAAIASALGNARGPTFDVIGHGYGAHVAMALAGRGGIGKLVLLDGLGRPDDAARQLELQLASRLGSVHCSANAFIEAVGEHRHLDQLWSDCYREELQPAAGGLQSRSSREACFEDAAFVASHDARALWRELPSDVLVVRALAGHSITPEDSKQFRKSHPKARVVEVDCDHYGVMSESVALNAIAEYLS